MKKVMILGGGENQVQLINAAKEEGYNVLVCDWKTDIPGFNLADKFIQVSTLDSEAVLKVAIEEKINGVISNSEPAMANVAYIANKLNLIGNPLQSLEILLSKNRFRELQDKSNLYAPKHYCSNNVGNILDNSKKFNFPVIIKPNQSSGSRGTTYIQTFDERKIINAFYKCQEFSRDSNVEIEEFVKLKDDYIIDGDIFVFNDYIIWNGLFKCLRMKDFWWIPTSHEFPLNICDTQLFEMKHSISTAIKSAGIVHGEFNVEGYFTNNDDFFIIEINPRQGGNSIPSLIQQQCGLDLNRLLLTTCVGDISYFENVKSYKFEDKYLTNHMFFSSQIGIFKGIEIDSSLSKYVIQIDEYRKGEFNNGIENAASVLGRCIIQYPDQITQKNFDSKLDELIIPVIN